MRSCTTSRSMPCLLELSTCQKETEEEGDDRDDDYDYEARIW